MKEEKVIIEVMTNPNNVIPTDTAICMLVFIVCCVLLLLGLIALSAYNDKDKNDWMW